MDPFIEPAIAAINLLGLLGLGSSSRREASRLVDEGFALVERGRYEEAVDVLSKALELDPDDVEALERRASAYLMLDRREPAIADLHKAASLAPQNADVRAGLCAALCESDPVGALSHCDVAIRLDEEDGPSFNNRSTALGLLGRDDEALADLDRAIALAPDEVTFRSNRAITLIEIGAFDRAAADVDRSLALEPNDPTMMLALARIVLARGDATEARALAGSILERGSGHAEALATSGWISLAEGAHESAIETFDTALGRPAGIYEGDLKERVRWIALAGRSLARRRLGDETGADADLDAARTLKPSVDRVISTWIEP